MTELAEPALVLGLDAVEHMLNPVSGNAEIDRFQGGVTAREGRIPNRPAILDARKPQIVAHQEEVGDGIAQEYKAILRQALLVRQLRFHRGQSALPIFNPRLGLGGFKLRLG